MCGFFITNFPIQYSDKEIIESGIRFRGPDSASDLVRHHGWTAYHARLAIIDLSVQTNQPMIDDKGGMLVFNGEILNYKALGKKYFDQTYTSDTTLLSHLLMTNQLDMDEIDGFFAFVYIDSHGELRHAARDKFGVKPLFHYSQGNKHAFSSEPIVLKNLFGLRKNNAAVQEYYATRAPIFSGSYFEGVDSIQPGTCFVKGTYFNCLDYLQKDNKATSLDDVERAVRHGITSRLVSDAPVGLLLSRGIDSNLIKELGDFDRYYTIGFEGDEDLEYLKQQSIPHLTKYECSAEEYRNEFEYLLTLRGEPMSVPNEVLLYIIAKRAAADGIKVLLSGEGADEFFGGYDRVFRWAASDAPFDLDEFLAHYCYITPDTDSKVYEQFRALFTEVAHLTKFEKVRWFFIRYHMPILFRRLDFSLMAAGIEGREPLANLHTFMVAICYSAATLMNADVGKLPLRELIAPKLGTQFAYEKKVGFPVNLLKVFNVDTSVENHATSYETWFEQNLKVLN